MKTNRVIKIFLASSEELEADRYRFGNLIRKLDNIYDSHHEAVLRMIQMVVDNAHKEGIWAGICGELGADTTLTERFVEMGLDELSVSPTFVLPVRKIVREME